MRLVPLRVKASSSRRCSVLKLWVTEPVLIATTLAMAAAWSTPRVKLAPKVSLAGALVILGRVAKPPAVP